jgi:hypothetical protein
VVEAKRTQEEHRESNEREWSAPTRITRLRFNRQVTVKASAGSNNSFTADDRPAYYRDRFVGQNHKKETTWGAESGGRESCFDNEISAC